MHYLVISVLIFLFYPSLNASVQGEVPIYLNGRYRAAEANQQTPFDELYTLPSKQNKAEWLPLKELKIRNTNFTAYNTETFEKLRQAYLSNDEKLPQLLLEAYSQIAGQPYLHSAKRSLHFPSLSQLKAEYIYLHYPWIIACIACYATSFLLLLFRKNTAGLLAAWTSFALLSWILALRIFVLERPPVSNMAETLLFVPWLATAFSLLLRKETLVAATLLSTALLGAAWLGNIQTSFDNVQAVLDSNYWLTVHVLLVVGSYGLFLLAGILGHAYFIARIKQKESLAASIARKIQWTANGGLALLIPGTILGGIWAAQSWGRFWDWDPKESWAFITICSYLLGVHAYRYRLIGDYGLACAAILGAWTVTFTWYGVNYILGTGLHSYGFGNGGEKIYLAFLLTDAILFAALAYAAKNTKASSLG